MKKISLENLEAYTRELEKHYAQKTDLPSKVSDLDNDAKYQTEEQMTAAIAAKVSSTYKAGGSVVFANLPDLSEASLGLVVNVTDALTTTDNFIEGAGAQHPAGTNVAVVQAGEGYKYDVLAGFVDLSGFASTEALNTAKAAAVTQANADTDEKLAGYVKAADLEEVTEEEIIALFTKD